jgi:hypothetical protein
MRLEPLVQLSLTMRRVPIGPTPTGMRVNLELEGGSEPGGRVQGRVRGTDYLTIRQDGLLELNVQATLTSDDGELVAINGTGVGVHTADGSVSGRLALRFGTAGPGLSWMNTILGIAATRANMETGSLDMVVHTLED